MNFLISIGIRILEVLFFAGWIGAAIVILITGVEDVETALGHDDSEPQP